MTEEQSKKIRISDGVIFPEPLRPGLWCIIAYEEETDRIHVFRNATSEPKAENKVS